MRVLTETGIDTAECLAAFGSPAELASRNRTSPSGASSQVSQPSARTISARSDSLRTSESSVSSVVSSLVSDYKTIRAELEQYGHGLDKKPETIVLTKTDLVDSATISFAIKELSKLNGDILTASVLDDDSIKAIKDEVVRRLRKQ